MSLLPFSSFWVHIAPRSLNGKKKRKKEIWHRSMVSLRVLAWKLNSLCTREVNVKSPNSISFNEIRIDFISAFESYSSLFYKNISDFKTLSGHLRKSMQKYTHRRTKMTAVCLLLFATYWEDKSVFFSFPSNNEKLSSLTLRHTGSPAIRKFALHHFAFTKDLH